jgi:hypothetical protein
MISDESLAVGSVPASCSSLEESSDEDEDDVDVEADVLAAASSSADTTPSPFLSRLSL